MKKLILIIVCFLLLCAAGGVVGTICMDKYSESCYNKGVEAFYAGNYTEAEEYLMKAAIPDNKNGLLGVIYYNGHSGKRDLEKAASYLGTYQTEAIAAYYAGHIQLMKCDWRAALLEYKNAKTLGCEEKDLGEIIEILEGFTSSYEGYTPQRSDFTTSVFFYSKASKYLFNYDDLNGWGVLNNWKTGSSVIGFWEKGKTVGNVINVLVNKKQNFISVKISDTNMKLV